VTGDEPLREREASAHCSLWFADQDVEWLTRTEYTEHQLQIYFFHIRSKKKLGNQKTCALLTERRP